MKGSIADREAELNGTQGGDENAEEDGDGAIAHDLSAGPHDAGLPGTHLVPAPRVEERFLKVPPFPSALFPETHPSATTSKFGSVQLVGVCENVPQNRGIFEYC